MRRIVIIALVLAIFVGGAIVMSRLLDERLGYKKVRAVVQNFIAKIKPQPVVPRPPADPLSKPLESVGASKSHEPGRMKPEDMPSVVMPSSKPKPAPMNQPPEIPAPVNRLPYTAPPPPEEWAKLSASQRLANARGRLQPQLDAELASKGFKLGDAAFIRVFKESNELELWLRSAASSKPFGLFCNYRIAFYSGVLGPKTQEGDMQAPEGFYSVLKPQLNPASSYHLSFNIGYPNEYDQANQRTGSLIMVHGSNASIGCFAMTDPVIEEIYLIVEAALNSGQECVPVHVFPFRMTDEGMTNARATNDEWIGFWENLKEGHDAFEAQKQPPRVSVREGRYVLVP